MTGYDDEEHIKRECPVCDGTGERVGPSMYDMDTEIECYKCDGKGWVRKRSPLYL